MRPNLMFVAMAAVAVTVSGSGAQSVDRARVNQYGRPSQDGPTVNVWIDRYSYASGERIHTYFEAEEGSYVTVLRVTSRGELKVLYPHTPTVQRAFSNDLLVNGEIPYATDASMYLNEPSGVGFVFAIASYTPFNYRSVTSGGRWSTVQLASNHYEDPFVVVNRFVSRTLPRQIDYSVDFIEYEVTGGGRLNRAYANSEYSRNLNYDDLYFQCLRQFGAQALTYCRSYALYGGAPYGFGAGPGRIPSALPTGGKTTAIQPRMHPPRDRVPDPVVREEGLKPRAPEPNPTGNEVQVYRSTPRDGGRSADGGDREAARRAEPRDASPSEYRIIERSVPSAPQRYEPAPQRSEPVQRYEPAPQPRVEPAPVGTMPRYEAPVVRAEPRPAPPPPPPAPAPQPSPPPAPVSNPVPVIPPAAPPAVDH